jgi:hypothetical protein
VGERQVAYERARTRTMQIASLATIARSSGAPQRFRPFSHLSPPRPRKPGNIEHMIGMPRRPERARAPNHGDAID